MPNKRLQPSEVDEMKKLVKNGTAPQDLADHFGIAISSVHNWKKKFEAEGMKIPSVRGQRPRGTIQPSAARNTTPAVVLGTKPVAQTQAPGKTAARITAMTNPLRVVVNGVLLQVDASAKSVQIGKDGINVEF